MLIWALRHVYLFKLVFYGYVPGVRLPDFKVTLFLVFKEFPYCLPSWLCQITFPPIYRKFLFFFPAFIICRLFDEGHSDSYEKYLLVVLICTFLMISDIEHFFMCLLAIVRTCFQRMKFYYRYFSYSTQHLIDSRCTYLSLLFIHPSIHSLKIEAQKPHVSDTLLGVHFNGRNRYINYWLYRVRLLRKM